MQTKHEIVISEIVLIGGAVSILAATLRPFTFSFHRLAWTEYIASFSLAPSGILDFPANILLFLPLGFGLASLLDRRSISRGAKLYLAIIIGFLTAAFIESLQIFLPERTANVSDVIANTLGTALGLACFRLWQRRQYMAQLLRTKLTLRNIVPVYIAYLLVMMLLVWALMQGMIPGGWETSYKLALGNEITKDRPWQGRVQDLLILDRAVDKESASRLLAGEIPPVLDDAVVAAYPLSGNIGLKDRKGGLPDLVPQVHESPELGPDGVAFDEGLWLATEKAVVPLTDRINSSGQFTIALTVSSFDLTQEGPARILTISLDPFHRNLTLGQEGKHLAMRWRSPLTGENGMNPEIQFPGVFDSFEPQRMVISCNGITTGFYTTRGEADRKVFLGPEIGLLAILREDNYWSIVAGRFAFWQSNLLISVLMFLPLGMLLGAAFGVAQRKIAPGLIAGGLFLPALLLEGFVARYVNGPPRLGTIAFCIVITSVGFVIIQWKRSRPCFGGANRAAPRLPLN
jgi:glycopeptide antibiotics resistance protein